MATEKWIAGTVGLTWTALGTTVYNSLASGSAILDGTSLTNGTNLDIFCDLSLHLASAAFVAPNFIGVYLYPLCDDGSTYGDGRFGTAAAGPPASHNWVGNIEIPATTAAQNGVLSRIIMPPGTFEFVLWNKGGVNWASSGNTLKYRTYDRAIA